MEMRTEKWSFHGALHGRGRNFRSAGVNRIDTCAPEILLAGLELMFGTRGDLRDGDPTFDYSIYELAEDVAIDADDI